jgi:hypothetical protein
VAGKIGLNLAEAHARLLHDHSIQFFLTAPRVQQPPPWLVTLIQILASLGPILRGAFWIGAVLVVLGGIYLLVRLTRSDAASPTAPALNLAALDRPTPARATALLAEADRLAAAQRYGEGVRVLLERSIEDIRHRRPTAFGRSATVREIARSPELSIGARSWFQEIGRVVEMFVYAGRTVDAAAYQRCRAAYEAFAEPQQWTSQ